MHIGLWECRRARHKSVPRARLLSQTLVRREAVLTSRIKGTQASLSDLVLHEAQPDRPAHRDVGEVLTPP